MTKRLTDEQKAANKAARQAKPEAAKAAPVVETVNPMASFVAEKPVWTPDRSRMQDWHLTLSPEEIFASKVDFVDGHTFLKFGSPDGDQSGEFTLNTVNREISRQVGRALALLQTGEWSVAYDLDGVTVHNGAYILRHKAANRLLVVYTEQSEGGPIARVQEYHYGDKDIIDPDYQDKEQVVGWRFHRIENNVRKYALEAEPRRTVAGRNEKRKGWVIAYTKYHFLAKMLVAQERAEAIDYLFELHETSEALAAAMNADLQGDDVDKRAEAGYYIKLMSEASGVRMMRYDEYALQSAYTSELWINSGYKFEELQQARRMFARTSA